MSGTNPYVDVMGRAWPVAKLDALLTDPEVLQTVLTGASVGLRSDRTWRPAFVLEWAGWRYTREEPTALLLLLVTRFFDTKGAHHLGREPVR
jgi:hypothetical protein